MNTILVVFALCLSGAFASPIAKADSYEDTQERTLINANSGMYLGLNTTTLVIGLVVIAALVVGILALTSTGLLDEVSGQQQRYDQQQYYQHEEQPYRAKRSYDESKFISFDQLINPLHPNNQILLKNFLPLLSLIALSMPEGFVILHAFNLY